MQIILANPRGFCAGVYMAVEVVDQLLDLRPGETIYVYHEIVHNRHVVGRFVDRGVTFVDDLADVPAGSIVVFSAHGVTPAIRQEAIDRKLTPIDATCPLVTKVHAEAIRYARRGFQILLIGHANHQEVIGTRGEAPDAIQVVESPADIPNLDIHDPAKLIYLTQTTLSVDDAEKIIAALQRAFPQIQAPPSDDICYATTNRQGAVRQLAPECDLVLVVGSVNSSNSVRLTEIAALAGTPARLLDDADQLDHAWFDGVERVLITAGASAPEDLVRGIIEAVVERHGGSVEQHEVYRESIEFALPGSLKKFMRANDLSSAETRVRLDSADAIDEWMDERQIPHRTVDLTITAGGSPPQDGHESN